MGACGSFAEEERDEDGADEDAEDGGEDEDGHGEHHFDGGFEGFFLDAEHGGLAEVAGLFGEEGGKFGAEFLGLDDEFDGGGDELELGAVCEGAECGGAGGAEADFVEDAGDFLGEGAAGESDGDAFEGVLEADAGGEGDGHEVEEEGPVAEDFVAAALDDGVDGHDGEEDAGDGGDEDDEGGLFRGHVVDVEVGGAEEEGGEEGGDDEDAEDLGGEDFGGVEGVCVADEAELVADGAFDGVVGAEEALDPGFDAGEGWGDPEEEAAAAAAHGGEGGLVADEGGEGGIYEDEDGAEDEEDGDGPGVRF